MNYTIINPLNKLKILYRITFTHSTNINTNEKLLIVHYSPTTQCYFFCSDNYANDLLFMLWPLWIFIKIISHNHKPLSSFSFYWYYYKNSKMWIALVWRISINSMNFEVKTSIYSEFLSSFSKFYPFFLKLDQLTNNSMSKTTYIVFICWYHICL